MGLSRTVSGINGNESRKSQNFPSPSVFGVPAEGHLELGIGAWGQKTKMMRLTGRERSLTISSAVWIQYTNVTDRRTSDTGRQRSPPLRMASRGNDHFPGLSYASLFRAATYKSSQNSCGGRFAESPIKNRASIKVLRVEPTMA